jgi:hypothetical protein
MRIVAGIQKCIRSRMRNCQQMAERLIVSGREIPKARQHSTLNYLSALAVPRRIDSSLFNHFLQLRAEHSPGGSR